jgi:hypothetical protein
MLTNARRLRGLALGCLAAALLAACGGGSDEVSSPAFASGLWRGASSAGRDVDGVVLQDGSYYFLYSAAGTPGVTGGFVQGTGRFVGTTFTSSDLRDYSVEGAGVQAGSLAAEVRPKTALRADITTTRLRQVFDTSYDSRYERPASLATLAGSYTGEVAFSLGRRPATFTVTPTGQVSTTINGCAIGGQVAPRAEGDVYDLTIVFSGAPCVFPNWTFTGVALLRGNQLRGLVQDARRTQGIVFAGTRD